MAQDWFALHAPKATPTSEPARDWFAQNAAPSQQAETARPAGPVDISPGDDIRKGIAKGVLNTVTGLGEMVHRIPGVTRAVDALYGQEGLSDRAFQASREVARPSNTAQRVGFTAEQVGEFFVPGAGASKLAQVPKAAMTTLAQSGSLADAAVSGGLTAVMPGASAARKGAKALRASAEHNMTQALGPTKEWAKTEAAKLAPQMLDRGVKGSRDAMLQQAKAMSDQVGARIGAAYKAAAEAGQTISGEVIRGELQLAKDGLMVTTQAGKKIPLAGAESAFAKLDDLEKFVLELGDDIPVDKAAAIKSAWDKIVSKSGLYGPKAMASATDNASAWAVREGASAFRRLLDDVPDVTALNKEYQFWAGLKNVIKETQKRTQGQTGGLMAGVGGGGAGAVVGAVTGGGVSGAMLGGLAGRQLVAMLQSPTWRTTVTAPMKDRLASALASGKTGDVLLALGKISAAAPGLVRNALPR